MTSVRLESGSGDASVSLAFSDAHFEAERFAGSDAYWMQCQVSLRVDGDSTDVGLSMIQPYREDTLDFFEELSSRPDGWVGGANWYSEANEIRVDALGRGSGLVALRVELRRFAHSDAAGVGEFVVSYDDLRQFTWSLASFLRVSNRLAGSSRPAASPLGRWSFTDSTDASRGS